jgi:hypothetical protein
MSQMSTGGGKRAKRVIRFHKLPAYLGVCLSQINEAVKRGLLHPYRPLGARAVVVDEDEVIQLQEAAKARPLATPERKRIRRQ